MRTATVCIAYITDGSRPGRRAVRKSARPKTTEAAAKCLQVDRFKWLGLTEGSWTYEELQPLLLDMLLQTLPHLIYAPSRVDFHPEHRKVAHGLSLLLSKEDVVPAEAVVRACQLQVPLSALLVNQVVDCSDVSRRVEAALKVYKSQSANLGPALRMRRYAARFYGFTRHAEDFRCRLWIMPSPGNPRAVAGQFAESVSIFAIIILREDGRRHTFGSWQPCREPGAPV
jgi:LmbE family N-acetylglucosaminyl deacetylase